MGYLAYFRQVCKRYNIVFADADSDERDFVIRMAEKGYYPKRACETHLIEFQNNAARFYRVGAALYPLKTEPLVSFPSCYFWLGRL